MLQPARGILVEKVFQPPKVSTSLRKRFSNKLEDSLVIWKPFRQRFLHLAATLFKRRTFFTLSPRAGCNLGLLENLFNESSSFLKPWLVGTFSTNESSSRFELVGKPFRRGCNQLDDSTLKRFSKQLRLQLAWKLLVEKVFQPAKVSTSWRSGHRKGFQVSQCCNQHEESSLIKFSNQLRFRPAWGKGFPTSSRTPCLIGKPFRRRVHYLASTMFSWRTFCTTSPRAGCNLGLLENLFEKSSTCLDPWVYNWDTGGMILILY